MYVDLPVYIQIKDYLASCVFTPMNERTLFSECAVARAVNAVLSKFSSAYFS